MTDAFIDTDPVKGWIQKPDHGDWGSRGLSLDVLRLDRVHPVVSGNKWFKLKYALESILLKKSPGVVSFGGPYSNHLVALAYCSHQHQLPSSGIIRGEEPAKYSASLQQMKQLGMKLIFVSRKDYKLKEALLKSLPGPEAGYYYIPEGGQSQEGITGAGDILSLSTSDAYTHILCSVGTGTTMTGLINRSLPQQQVIGFSSLKIADRQSNALADFINENAVHPNYVLQYDYHFGGYAKKTPELISFMNTLFYDHRIPTDFVYTGKMFYGIMDLIRSDYFKKGDRLLAVHTGGLQGNRSLIAGTLDY